MSPTARQRRIVHLTTGRPAYETRTFLESRTLADAGYEVCNVTPGHVSSDDGVRIIPVRPPGSRAERMLVTPWIVGWRARRLRPAAWHIHDANLIPVALVLRLLGRCVVWDEHEILADQVWDRPWIPRRLRAPGAALVRMIERLAVRACSAAIFGEPRAAAGRVSPTVVIVRNFPRLEEDERAPSRHEYVAREPVALYTGDITYTRGAVQMVDAMARLPEAMGGRLALVGRINVPGLAEHLRAREGWPRVDFFGWAERDELRRHRQRARVGLAVLHPTRQYLHSVPTKLFEYMAAGLPVIASDFEPWRSFVQPFDCGMLVDPLDVDQLTDAIASLLSNPDEAWAMGQRGREAIAAQFNWSSEAATLLALYEALLGRPVPVAEPDRG